jgi:hypothetical protein
MHMDVYTYTCIYIYIYIERERERPEGEGATPDAAVAPRVTLRLMSATTAAQT